MDKQRPSLVRHFPCVDKDRPRERHELIPLHSSSAFFARLRITKVFAFDGFGNVAYIGWVPLDLYKSSGKSMRSKKQVHRKWPIPIQPEEGLAIEQLFAEGGEEIAEGEEKVGELIVQQ